MVCIEHNLTFSYSHEVDVTLEKNHVQQVFRTNSHNFTLYKWYNTTRNENRINCK